MVTTLERTNFAPVPELTTIVPAGEIDLGSYTLGPIAEGAHVPLNTQSAIEADFRNIPGLDLEELASGFDLFQAELPSRAQRPEKLLNALDALADSELQRKFTVGLFAVEVAKRYFSRDITTAETDWSVLQDLSTDTYRVKRLSDTVAEQPGKGQGQCVEYSLLAGEIMSRLGVETSFTVGYYRQRWPYAAGEYHAFLTADDGHTIIDPLDISNTLETSKPQGLIQSVEESTIFDDPANTQAYSDIFGKTRYYSSSPIPAIAEA